jgi:hypothetical protein
MNHAVNWEAISAIGQIVGAIAVVISLIYLAREIRSNARATRRTEMRSTLDAVTRFAQQVATHPDLAELRNRGFQDLESLEGTDRARFNSYMHALFRIVEDAYYQRLEGHLDPHRWRGLEAVLSEVMALPGVQAWWRSSSRFFGGEDFANYINQPQQTATRQDD